MKRDARVMSAMAALIGGAMFAQMHAHAQTQTRTQAPARADAGDATLGARIASQGSGSAPACIGCHGANGEGNAAAGFPKLAAQSADYLNRQLDAYAGGARANAVMTPIAQALNPEQRRATAEHYARLAPVPTADDAARTGDAASLLERGKWIASVGDEKTRVQACANCHGVEGIGEPPVYPYLAGQHREYLVASLKAWKDGSRNTDPSRQMPSIARALSDADVAAVTAYYARLPAPPVSAARGLTMPKATHPTSVPSGPVGKARAPSGLGTDQGTPTSGAQGQTPSQPGQ